MSERSFRVLVVGATGLVGREILSVLEERAFPIGELFLYASRESESTELEFARHSRTVEPLAEDLPGVDLAFLCATAEVHARIAPKLAAGGTLVIDLAGTVIGDRVSAPVLGPGDVTAGIANEPLRIAHPAARLLVAPLRALGEGIRLQKVVSTLVVPASAFGVEAVQRLGTQTISLLNAARGEREEQGSEEDPEEAEEAAEEDDASSLAFRCAPLAPEDPWVSAIRSEAEKLLGGGVSVSVQAIRAPVFYGQAASVSVASDGPVAIEDVRKRLREAPSVILVEGNEGERTTFDTLGIDAIQVSGLRQDPASPEWIHFWAMAENVRQGGALPAVALAESLLLRH